MTEPPLATEHGSWMVRLGDTLLKRLLLLVGLALLPTVAVQLEQADRRGLLLIALSAALTLGLTGWGAARFIARPMQRLLTASNRWAAGDYTARAGLASDRTEFGRLGAAFDAMAEALQARERRQGPVSPERRQSLEQLVAERTAALRASEARMRAYFENAPDMVFTIRIEPDGTALYEAFNPAAERFFGLAAGQPPPSVEAMLPGEQGREQADHYRACAASGATMRYEAEFSFAHGTRCAETVLVALSEPSGQARRVLATARDITERRSLQAQLAQAQKLEAVGQLTSGIAHDFNNLLTAVSGNLELIGRIAATRADVRTERLVDNAVRAANRGAQLTSQLLAFARKQKLKTERIAVGRMLIEINELLRGAAGETVRVTMRSHPDLWPCMTDAALLEAALINLVINARDAMPGGGALTIAASNASIGAEAALAAEIAPGDYVRLDVADAGTGIAPEHLPRLFEPFFTTKEVGRGSGLGLAMVHGFARQSGGAILVNSEVGRGTTMSLLLPRDHAVAAAPPESHEVSAAAPLRPGTVLLVEDDPEVLDVVTLGLVDAGHRVLPARDGREALDLLGSDETIDLLLSDIMLPGGKSGVEVAREARRLRPGLCVLLSSGYSAHVLLEAGAEPDEFAILPKPFTRAQLLQRIAEAVRATRHSENLAATG